MCAEVYAVDYDELHVCIYVNNGSGVWKDGKTGS
jgi:hypothetical protein